jgi:hypothetical protein
MNHEAIYALYPTVATIDDTAGAHDKDGNKVQIDMAAVNAWVDPDTYKYQRAKEYPSIPDQLDTLYHSGLDAWKAQIKTVKDKYPKA